MQIIASLLRLVVAFCPVCVVGFRLLSHFRTTRASQSSSLSTRLLFLEATVGDVEVYDSVFTSKTCLELHRLAIQHAARSESSVFYRPNQEHTRDLTPLEHALNSCLTALDDVAICDDPNHVQQQIVVEYWSRQDYRNMDVHADIDERKLLEEGIIHCPIAAHILYLAVKPAITRGPTCIFSQVLGGWDSSCSIHGKSRHTSMVTVPAVPGRVVRFPGSAMHAVPKPPNRWLLSLPDEQLLVQEEKLEEWDYDDVDTDDDAIERSVILFNTWSVGPRGVLEDYTMNTVPDGIVLDGAAYDDDTSSTALEQHGKSARRMDWQQEYGVDCRALWCRTQSEWSQATIVDHEGGHDDCSTAIRVSLMGNRIRRVHPKKYVNLKGASSLKKALEEERQPSRFQLAPE
jgi:hypothetical protein